MPIERKDLVLVQVPCWTIYSPPYNLALLKAVCQDQGYSVRCLDLNVRFYRHITERGDQALYENSTNWYNENYVNKIVEIYDPFIDSCVKEILSFPSLAVGFSNTGLSRLFSEVIAKRLKAHDPARIIIFGGPYCFRTEFGETILHRNPAIDVVCLFEGEEVLPQLLHMIKNDKRITDVKGIIYRNGTEIIDCGDAPMLEDLDSLPFADYSDFDLAEYRFSELPLSHSRGCINRCKFCSESAVWSKYRFRNAENIFAEMKHQLVLYPHIKSFYFNASLINGNLRVVDELSDLLLENQWNIQWGGQGVMREDFSDALIQKMRRAGFSHVSYGLETASARLLSYIGKRFSPQVAERIIRTTKKAGIRTDVNLVVGFPDENENDILETARFLKRNSEFIDEIFFHPLIISKGSYFYNHRQALGIEFEEILNPNSWYCKASGNNLEKRLEWLAFYKAYIGRSGKDFLDLGEYYVFVADDSFDAGDYKKAIAYYQKAEKFYGDRLDKEFIVKKIAATVKKIAV